MSKSRTRIWLAGGAFLVLCLIAVLFKPEQVSDSDWDKSFSISSDEPYGLSIFKGLLDHSYDEGTVVVCEGYCDLPDGDASGYGYLYIGLDYWADSSYFAELVDFSSRGGQVLLIADYMYARGEHYTLETGWAIDSIREAALMSDSEIFRFEHTMKQLDSTEYISVYAPDIIDSLKQLKVDTILSIQDSVPVYTSVSHGADVIYLHTLVEMFSNVSLKYGDGLDHYNYVMNYIGHIDQRSLSEPYASAQQTRDTLLLQNDHGIYLSKRASMSKVDTLLFDSVDNYKSDDSYSGFNPIAFIFSNQALKWSYFLILLGAISYIYFRGKRRQAAIPTLAQNENTSLEFVETLSHLFRLQNKPSYLSDHMEDNIKQYIKRKYYIDSNTHNYIEKVSRKSKVTEEEISLLFKRISAAKNNPRFREEQLVNLNKAIEEFYNKCQ